MKSRRTALLVAVMLPAAAAAAERPLFTYPTAVPGVRGVVAPPDGFDATRADDDTIAAFGLPARPDRLRHPAEYAQWSEAMRSVRHRVMPHLAPRHGRAGQIMHDTDTGSYNWGGFVFDNFTTSYNVTSFQKVYSVIVVPTVSQAHGVCSGGWQYASEWIGIDGAISHDVMQAGIDTDSYCAPGQAGNNYKPWFEWYPAYGWDITNVPTGPGQKMFVGVWASTSTVGNVYMQNMTTGVATQLQFYAPAGTQLVGNNMEWIVERPQVNGKTSTLPHFTPVNMVGWGNDGWGNYYYPGAPFYLTNDNWQYMYNTAQQLLVFPGLNRYGNITVYETGTGG